MFFGRKETETTADVLLKFLSFALVHRDRLQIGPELHDDNLRLTPDLVQLDYTMRPGPVTRSNALALMRAVGLEVPDSPSERLS